MKEKIAIGIGIIVFFGLFIGLLSLVGNPAAEETIIIFVIALMSSIFSYIKLGGDVFKKLWELIK